MRQHRRKNLFAISIICVLIYSFLFNTVSVFADEPVPPVDTEEAISPPVDELPDNPDQSVEDDSQPPVDNPVDPSELSEQTPVTDEITDDELQADTDAEAPTDSPDEQLPVTEDTVEATGEVPDTSDETADETSLTTSDGSEPLEQLPADTSVVVVVDGFIFAFDCTGRS